MFSAAKKKNKKEKRSRVQWSVAILAQAILAQVSSLFFWFSFAFCKSSCWTQRMEHNASAGEVGARDHAPSLSNGHTEGREAPATTSARSYSQQGRWRQPHVRVARGSHRHRRQGSGRRTPTKVAQKSAFPNWRRHLELWGTTTTTPNLREPTNKPCLCQFQTRFHNARVSGTGQEEGGSRQRVVVASPDRVDTVECRGGGLERPQSPVVSVDMSAEGAEVACSSGTIVEGEGRCLSQTDPNPKRVCRREDFVLRCEEEMQEWIQGRQWDLQAAIVAGHLSKVARISQLMSSAAQEWRRIFRCHLQWRTW